ncbi:hypothetical protein LCGC14_2929290 [marine sediment metagenome]|uniref:Uncharacterized protein n=1 Tax=marine sediment metagenome TaxID=412755 RepID=A0A0F8ZU19_9ZZZZ
MSVEMSEDRLEEIRKQATYGYPADVYWLISEVERLQRELRRLKSDASHNDPNWLQIRDQLMTQKATIATLREAYGHFLACDVEQLYDAADRASDNHIAELLRVHAGVMAIRHKAIVTNAQEKK